MCNSGPDSTKPPEPATDLRTTDSPPPQQWRHATVAPQGCAAPAITIVVEGYGRGPAVVLKTAATNACAAGRLPAVGARHCPRSRRRHCGASAFVHSSAIRSQESEGYTRPDCTPSFAAIAIAIAATKARRWRPISPTRAALPGRHDEAAEDAPVAHCTPSHSAAGQSGASPATARSAKHRNWASELSSPLDKTMPFSSASR